MWGTSQKRELIIVGTENGLIGKTSHKKGKNKNKNKNKNKKQYDRRGESARWVLTYDFFVFSLGYLPFARVEANRILQAGSRGREILKTEQEIRISETWTFFFWLRSVPKSLPLSEPIQLRWTTLYLFIFLYILLLLMNK